MATSKRLFILVGMLSLLVALPFWSVYGGSLGKIQGRVLDATNAPLPGASVVIEGTQRGTVTDADGYYLLLALDPGKYSLTASLVGYTNVTQEEVGITVDHTTIVDFSLKEEAIEAAEIVVTAERPPVELDKTATKYLVTADDIEQTPIIKTTAEFISLQPGVDQAGTFTIRGSDTTRGTNPNAWGTQWYAPNDTYVMVDGVRIPNQDGHSAILFTGINKSAVQQISVETGVTPAEYGDAQAGTINIVTKDGGKEFHGWSEVNFEPAGQKHWGANIYDAPSHRNRMDWDNPEWLGETDPLTGRIIHVREDYASNQGVRLEGSLSGPLGPKAGFIVSAKHDRRASTYPAATSHGFYNDRGQYLNAPDYFSGSGSVTLKPTPNTKFKLGLILETYTAYNDEVNEYGYANEGFIRGTRHSLRNLFLPKNWAGSGQYDHQEDLEYITFTHTLSPKTFYEVRISRSHTGQDTVGAPAFTTDSRKDKSGWFIIDREIAMWVDSQRTRLALKADVSSQITKGNFAKVGFEAVSYDAYYTYWGARSKSDNWFTYYAGGDTPWEMGTPAQPIRGSLYAQDKMEFEGLIVNVGLRLDFQKHRHEELVRSGMHWAPMWRRYSNRHYGYGVGAGNGVEVPQNFALTPPTHVYLSPRLGISHPITDRMVMHFSLGRFVQWMDLYRQYAKSYRNFGRIGPDGDPSWVDLNNNGVKDAAEHLSNMDPHYSGFGGDPWTLPEETLTFEVGADWNFVSDYTATLTMFYRNETQQIRNDGTGWYGPKRGSHYTRGKANSAAAYIKGVELALGKRMSNYFSFRVAWTASWSAFGNMGLSQYGASVLPDSNFVRGSSFWYDFTYGADGAGIAIPLTEKEKEEFSQSANNSVRSLLNSRRDNPQRFYGKMPEFEDDAIFIDYRSLGGNRYGPMGAWAGQKSGWILAQANVQFVMNTPSDVRFGPRWMSWMASDLSANMLWKMRSGGRVRWTPPGQERRVDHRSIDATTDLSVEKVFNAKGRVRPALFVEVRNLFEDKIDTANNTDYMRWGLMMARPDNADFIQYGDFRDRSYFKRPRQTNIGLRVIF
jgi:hypothetical protein